MLLRTKKWDLHPRQVKTRVQELIGGTAVFKFITRAHVAAVYRMRNRVLNAYLYLR